MLEEVVNLRMMSDSLALVLTMNTSRNKPETSTAVHWRVLSSTCYSCSNFLCHQDVTGMFAELWPLFAVCTHHVAKIWYCHLYRYSRASPKKNLPPSWRCAVKSMAPVQFRRQVIRCNNLIKLFFSTAGMRFQSPQISTLDADCKQKTSK